MGGLGRVRVVHRNSPGYNHRPGYDRLGTHAVAVAGRPLLGASGDSRQASGGGRRRRRTGRTRGALPEKSLACAMRGRGSRHRTGGRKACQASSQARALSALRRRSWMTPAVPQQRQSYQEKHSEHPDRHPRISAAPADVVQYGWSLWAYRSRASRSTSARSSPIFRCGTRLAEDATADETGDAELVDAEDLGGLCAADADPGLPLIHAEGRRDPIRCTREADSRLWKPPADGGSVTGAPSS